MEHFEFKEFISNKIKEKGIDLKRLSEFTNIPLRHLKNLVDGNVSDLPPAPYLRGYLKKLADALDFNPDKWWEYFKHIDEIRKAGEKDKLPKNRFKSKPIGRYILLFSILIIIGFYIAIRMPFIIGKPVIEVYYPKDPMVDVSSSSINIRGYVRGGNKIFVNNERVNVSDNGKWEKSVNLAPGLNTIEIKSSRFLGNETKIIKQVMYNPEESGGNEGLDKSSETSTVIYPDQNNPFAKPKGGRNAGQKINTQF